MNRQNESGESWVTEAGSPENGDMPCRLNNMLVLSKRR